MSSDESGVLRLDPDDPVQVDAIARLHLELLPASSTARFGPFFMTRFYFTRMVRSGLVAAHLYRHEGEYVGFSVFTEHPDSFMREGIRRHFFALCWISAVCFLADPRRLAIPSQMMRNDALAAGEPGMKVGYWLTFGVKDTHTRLRVGERGQRISNLLVHAMVDFFRKAGFDRLDGGVERNNKSALFFYHSCGFRLRDPGDGPALQIPLDLKHD